MKLKYLKPKSFYEEFFRTLDTLPLKNKAKWFIKQKYLGGYIETDSSFIEMLVESIQNSDERFNNNSDSCRRCATNLTTEENRQIEHKDNWIILERCKAVLVVVDKHLPDLIKYTTPLKKCLNLLAETHQNNYLITLEINITEGFIQNFILGKKLNINTNSEEYDHELCIYDFHRDKFNFEKLKARIQNQRFEWKYSEEVILDMVRRVAEWRDIERDISIYKEVRKGVFFKNIMEKHNLSVSAISKIAKKVRGKVNYFKVSCFTNIYIFV